MLWITRNIVRVFTIVLIPLKFIAPKKGNLIIFGNTYGYQDNPKYLFEYCMKNCPELNCIWIYKNPPEDIPSQYKEQFLYSYSFKGLRYQLQSKINIVTCGFGDISRFSIFNTINIQLWHGTPLKKIILDDNSYNFLLTRQLYKFYLRFYKYIISPSDIISTIFARAFNLNKESIIQSGYPRADVILNHVEPSPGKSILYAPTWRQNHIRGQNPIDTILTTDFIEELQGLGYSLTISLHPKDMELLSNDVLNEIDIIESDINIGLPKYDILVTDYSSICFDFALLGRPVLFYCHDLETYQQDRGLYDHYSILAKGMLASTKEELMALLKSSPIADNRFNDFNTFNQGSSCRYLSDFIVTLTNDHK